MVGTRVEVLRDGDTNLTFKTEMVLDTETGVMVERKTVVAEVELEDGTTAVIAGQNIAVAQVQVNTLLTFTQHEVYKTSIGV